jgi:hypothetical protein
MENNDYTDSFWYSRKWRREIINDFCRKEFKIEIKPSMGDDFPSVLRQMKRNGADTLFVGAFKARACTLEHVRKMFDPFKIVTVDEVREVFATAKPALP